MESYVLPASAIYNEISLPFTRLFLIIDQTCPGVKFLSAFTLPPRKPRLESKAELSSAVNPPTKLGGRVEEWAFVAERIMMMPHLEGCGGFREDPGGLHKFYEIC